MKVCPKCHLKCLNNAAACECGHLFEGADTTYSPSVQPRGLAKAAGATAASRSVALDPVLFANFVNESFVLALSFEDDLSLAPNQEQCKRLSISDREKLLCANEFVLLRALGACLFVRNLDEGYYAKFKETLLLPVLERMRKHVDYPTHTNHIKALEKYIEELKPDSCVGFSLEYLARVYPDSPRSADFLVQGLPIGIAFNYVSSAFDMVRNGYSLLLTGMDYASLEEWDSAFQKVGWKTKSG